MFERLVRLLGGRATQPPSGAGLPGRLQRGARAAAKEVAALQRQVRDAERSMERLRSLDEAGTDASGLENLLRRLDVDGVERHLRAAVARASRVETPVPHLLVTDLWPEDLFAAMVDTLPPPVFFDGEAGLHTLVLPPRLAPLATVVVWTWVADLARGVLGPALAQKFDGLLANASRLQASGGALVRRAAGEQAVREAGGVLVTIVDVLGAGGAGAGARVVGDTATPLTLPFRPNSALTALPGQVGLAAPGIVSSSSFTTTYEFSYEDAPSPGSG
jgi:hypothetical protein